MRKVSADEPGFALDLSGWDGSVTEAEVAEAEAEWRAEQDAEQAARDRAGWNEPDPDEPDADTDPDLASLNGMQRETWASEDGIGRAERQRRYWLIDEFEGPRQSPPTPAQVEEQFWTSRPWLTALRDFSRDELASPWAVLGAVLALASAHVAPNVVLPPRRGNGLPGAVGSLNVFSVLAGPPGSNKSVAVSVASAFLDVIGGTTPRKAGPGSGEGIVAAFGTEDASVPGGYRYRAVSLLMHADEVTALDALMRRTSSTLLPFLRTAWSGGDLSTLNAESTRQRFVPEHAYRVAMTVGVQPNNAGVLLADADGGLPQRMLWFSAVDPEVGTHPDSGTGPWTWTVPTAPPMLVPDPSTRPGPVAAGTTVPLLPVLRPREQITMPQEAFDAYRAAATAAGRGEGNALDGHAAQARGRVTALLALLDGRTTATEDDWNLAGSIMLHSDATRESMVAAGVAEAARANEARGKSEGVRAAVADISRDDDVARRAGIWALDRLRRAHDEGADGMTWTELTRACKSTIRGGLPEALDALYAAGQITAEAFDHNSQSGVRYRAARGSK